jgi:hypothetical protein
MTTPDPHPPYTSAAIDAVTEAVEAEHDFGEWLSRVLAYAAARAGSLDALTAGRPGSWEAALVDQLVRGLVFDDADLARYAEADRAREAAGKVPGDD